jgi:5-methylcytosine-specific restriction endonuclease McrA
MTDKIEPWKEFPKIWKTKSAFMSWLRGGIRKNLWSRSPIKMEYIAANRKKVLNTKTGNMVWGGTCNLCGNDFLAKDLQVDHIVGNHSLREIEDIQNFIESISCISLKDLQYVCKPCHEAKTLAEKKGVSFEEAMIEKRVIALCKDVDVCKKILDKHGLPSNNGKIRKQSVRKLLEDGIIE